MPRSPLRLSERRLALIASRCRRREEEEGDWGPWARAVAAQRAEGRERAFTVGVDQPVARGGMEACTATAVHRDKEEGRGELDGRRAPAKAASVRDGGHSDATSASLSQHNATILGRRWQDLGHHAQRCLQRWHHGRLLVRALVDAYRRPARQPTSQGQTLHIVVPTGCPGFLHSLSPGTPNYKQERFFTNAV